MTEKEALILLNMVDGIGPRTILKIQECFPDIVSVFGVNLDALTGLLGIKSGSARNILEAPGKNILTKELDRELDFIAQNKIKILTLLDPEYPSLLKTIYDPPPVLYVKGPADLSQAAVAIVGARSATYYGKETAHRLAYQLVSSRLSVISGLARGIDTHAHQGAVAAKGVTVGVMGCGFRYFYPRENKALADQIIVLGAIISEFPTNVPPLSQNFPRRNRTISGLSLGVVVVEAARKSGSLITANFALEQGRTVFAVPGRIDTPSARGALGLLKDGAKLVETVEDILEELGIHKIGNRGQETSDDRHQTSESLDLTETSLLNILGSDPVSVDEASRLSRIEVSQVLSILFGLELKHLVRQLPGKYYIKT